MKSKINLSSYTVQTYVYTESAHSVHNTLNIELLRYQCVGIVLLHIWRNIHYSIRTCTVTLTAVHGVSSALSCPPVDEVAEVVQ